MRKSNKESKISIRAICFTAIMAALIFVFTFTFKIPAASGYTHLGDSIIFLSVALLGSKKSSLAAGIGAAMADLVGGYAAWIVPTFIIKVIMVLICGAFAEKIIKNKLAGFIIGGVIGGAFQIAAYTAVKIFMYGKAYAFTSLPRLTLQTVIGIIVAVVFISVFNKTGITAKLRKMAE